jgi:hypothetical protein
LQGAACTGAHPWPNPGRSPFPTRRSVRRDRQGSAVLNVGWGDLACDRRPQRIHGDILLATFDFLARVVVAMQNLKVMYGYSVRRTRRERAAISRATNLRRNSAKKRGGRKP